MSKLKKFKLIIILSIILLLVGTSLCYAVDLNVTDDLTTGLTSGNESNNSSNTNNSSSTNTTDDESENTSNSSNTSSNTSNSSSSSSSNSIAKVTSSLPESSLGLSNILNILLIAVGVLLILLSIAILIRLKN